MDFNAAPVIPKTLTIVDATGKPFVYEMDGRKPVEQEIASITRDPLRLFFGGVQFNSDDTLKARGGAKGLKIYQECKRDAHAGAVLAKRKLAVTSRPYQMVAASDRRRDKQAADLVENALKYLRFSNLCKRALDATLNGYSVLEVMWEVRSGQVLPRRIVARDPRRFVFDVDDQLRLLTRANMLIGEPMPGRKFIVHRRGADDDSPYGLGVGSMLFWPVFFKRQGITFWLTFADKFGSPTALGRYPTGAGKPEQAKLLQALQAISQDAGVIVPEGMAIELLEATRGGSVATYESLVRYMDDEISKAVLGETMSTTAANTGLGSSQASVQDGVRMEVAVDDAGELDETLNDSLVRWIVDYNLPGAGYPLLEHIFDEPEDTAKLAERDQRLVAMGFRPSLEYVQQTYGDGWTLAPVVAPVVTQPSADDPQDQTSGNPALDPEQLDDAGKPLQFADHAPLGRQAAQREHNQAMQAAMTAGAEQLAGDWQAIMRGPVEALTARLEASGDLVDFREGLTAMLNRKPDAETVAKLAQAQFAAHVMGRGLAPQKPGIFKRIKALIGG